MDSNPRVPGCRQLMAIIYKYKYRKVLVFIATEESGSTEPGAPYLFRFPLKYYNVYIFTIVHPRVLVSYFNACISI